MRLTRYAVLAFTLVSASTLAGCAGETDGEGVDSSEDALTRVLVASECGVKAPNRSRTAGVYDASLSGCFITRGNDTSAAMLNRAIGIITNPADIGSATHPNNTKMFSSFKPTAPAGSLANGGTLSYDAKIGLDIVGPFDAKGTLRFTAQRTTEGVTLRVFNTTNVGAIGVNPLQPNGLQFVVTLTPAQNGLVITGSVNVTLVSQKDSVGSVSSVAPEIVSWLKGKLGAQ